MLNISVEKKIESKINISPSSIKRDWMDATPEKHAYRCFPVTQANMVGWDLSCSEDISFIWNGINDTTPNNIKIIKGHNFLYTGRGQSTISIVTGLVFRTNEDLSLMVINPVNYFNEKFETMSSLISTAWYDETFPIALKAKVANEEITIKAGEPVATIIPVSLTSLNNTSIEMYEYKDDDGLRYAANKSYGDAAQEHTIKKGFTDWYRNAVNEKGESLGSHETKSLRLYINDNRENK